MVGGSELKVLKLVKEGVSLPLRISLKTGFTNGYTNILCKALVKKGLIKTSAKGYVITPKGKKALEIPE